MWRYGLATLVALLAVAGIVMGANAAWAAAQAPATLGAAAPVADHFGDNFQRIPLAAPGSASSGVVPVASDPRVIQGTPTATLTSPSPTSTATPPTSTATPPTTQTPTAMPTVCGETSAYAIATTTGATVVPGTTNANINCDDCSAAVTLPFPFTLYDQTFTSVYISSNGTASFTDASPIYTDVCLPDTLFFTDYTIFPFWGDLTTEHSADGEGVFTSTTGTAPNRIFNIEWRAQYNGTYGPPSLDFELRLYENSPAQRFDIIYGSPLMDLGAETIGVQRNPTNYTQYACLTVGVSSGLMLSFNLPPCPSATATATGTPPTNTPAPTATQTSTPGTVSPTPTCSPNGAYRVLIVYADDPVPTSIPAALAAEPGITGVDLFDGHAATPSLAQLQSYQIVVPWSSATWQDHIALGNILDAYLAGGGIVVAFNFDWYGGAQSILGNWITNDSPYNNPGTMQAIWSGLGNHDPAHPLMQGVTSLIAYYRESLTLTSGATQVAAWADGPPLIATKGRTVGINAYVGDYDATYFGDFARVIANAGRWLNPPPCAPTPTATPPPVTVTATRTATPAPTATCAPAPGGWTAGPALPAPPATLVRSTGVYFPANGKFYVIGGRIADTTGLEFPFVLEYTPSTNTWAHKNVTLPDNQVSNMACGVLTTSGIPYIYCVGGSAGNQVTATARVFRYDPLADTVLTLTAADNWPGDSAGTILPGGFAVANNKLYILGGFDIFHSSTSGIYAFDPAAAVGSRWITSPALTPMGIMYAPTVYSPETGLIYVLGASDYTNDPSPAVFDTANTFAFNPTTNAIVTTVAQIPRASGETQAVDVDGKLWVLGGGRDAPNPSNEVDVYDPATNQWTFGPGFMIPRRNFPAVTDGSHVWLVGGYEPNDPGGDMEIYTAPVGCGPPTATTVPASATRTATVAASGTPAAPTGTVPATRTRVPSATPGGPSPTPCTVRFTDVLPTDYFYGPVTYLYCHGVISGFADNTFRPYTNTTRGQMVKIVVLGFNKPITTPSTGQYTFADVLPANPFFAVIETAAADQIVSGYACGGAGEPCDAQHRPYFRPSANVTRGQLSKIAALAASWALQTPATGTFADVAPGSAFYPFVETAACHGITSGYACGGPGEPCDPPQRPYFRQYNNATRGQIAKIVYLALGAGTACSP